MGDDGSEGVADVGDDDDGGGYDDSRGGRDGGRSERGAERR